MLVDELHLPFAFEQHAEQVERDDIALQHHAVDEEHRDRLVRPADRVQEHVLQRLALARGRVAQIVAEQRQVEIVRRHHRRSEEHTSELQSLMRISYAVFCLKKKKNTNKHKIKKNTATHYNTTHL